MKLNEAKTILKENGYILTESDSFVDNFIEDYEEIGMKAWQYHFNEWADEFLDICQNEFNLDMNTILDVWKKHPGVIDSNIDPERVANAVYDYSKNI